MCIFLTRVHYRTQQSINNMNYKTFLFYCSFTIYLIITFSLLFLKSNKANRVNTCKLHSHILHCMNVTIFHRNINFNLLFLFFFILIYWKISRTLQYFCKLNAIRIRLRRFWNKSILNAWMRFTLFTAA